MSSDAISLRHNLDPRRFMWLWAKYVRGVNANKHCTAAISGWYSTILSGTRNPGLLSQPVITLDERPTSDYRAIYICGVARQGYSSKPRLNYPHNLHSVIIPAPGARDRWVFENWVLEVTNGTFDRIPGVDDLGPQYRSMGEEFVSCRIFRWAVCNAGRFC